MHRLILSLFTACVLVLIITEYLKSKEYRNRYNSAGDSTVTVSISAVGDLMCHSPQFESARVSTDSFDFNPEFEAIKPYLQNSDFTFGNLEAVTAGRKKEYSGYPLFNVPDEFVSAVKFAGINLVTTSNNHALDMREYGLLRTIQTIKNNGLYYTGTYTSKRDRDSVRIFNIKGIKLAILAYSYGANGNYIPKGKPYLINLIDTVQIKSDIISARQHGAEAVLVYFHFGTEYKIFPNDYQKTIVCKTISYGADLIIGGHPHVIEPAEFFKTNNGKLDTGFVAYSMGNFISNQRWRYSDAGVILKIILKKSLNTGSISISKVTFLPTWVFKGNINNKNKFEILPAADTLNNAYAKDLTADDKKKMQQAFDDTKYILTKYTDKITVENISK
jgi:poly-gamma-glutamate capsule biosynthesis protein CapA/YwtB (metallophosphatase superfamily)